MYRGREADLQPRVERTRVRIVHVSAGARQQTLESLALFGAEVASLEPTVDAGAGAADAACERAVIEGSR
jgi:hypothetical protein